MKNSKTGAERPENGKNASLNSSMLAMFLSALVVCILLTIILFSLMGKPVYKRMVSREMLPQARSIAEGALKRIEGNISEDAFRFMMNSSDAAVVVLDDQKNPYALSEKRDGKEGGLPGRPDDGHLSPQDNEPPIDPEGNIGSKFDEYLNACRALYERVASENGDGYIGNDPKLGAIAAVPIIDGESNIRGAVFMIKPMHDVTETSKSLLVVLVISSLIAAIVMIAPIYLLSRKLTKPLKNLTSAAAQLSAGNYSERAKVEGSMEVCELGETFNLLADNLQANIGELTVERNRLRAILDGLGEGIIAFDTEGGVTQYNSSAVRLMGGSEGGDIRGLHCFAEVCDMARKAMSEKNGVVEVKKCGERAIRVSLASIEEENGQVAGAVALLMDITEAERLEQTRRDYVANVSHELRTPLASIRGIADMLNDGLVKNETDKARYYGYMLKESMRLSTLINDLLELSRLQSGGVALKLTRVELGDLIADVVDRTREPAAERGMSVVSLVPEGKFYANSNPDRMEQVLISLFDNAVKHGSEGGSIEVGIADCGDRWEISVRNPAEIEKKDLEHIFERFYKADIAHTGEGTGLGLAITEEVLRLMGETIRVKYENGVICFTFTAAKYTGGTKK
ncbi:MAG: cell wall metabolism sensor histidine kinase WalK [Clostridiales bacterium]|nr:cell wall metabolism sensor histidine kinase WalK [Clostridiales bacterium]